MQSLSSVQNYIGLSNNFHDGAIAIVNSSGDLVFAEATERPTQCKHAINISPDIIHHTGDLIRTYCEPDAKIAVATTWRERPEQQIRRVLDGSPTHTGKSTKPTAYAETAFMAQSWLRSMSFAGRSLDYELCRIGWPTLADSKIRTYAHHLTHAATGCFTSSFEEAACAIVDGYGEDASVAFYKYRGGELIEIPASKPLGTASLGFFYWELCRLCGFSILSGEEWKVMGLSAYGDYDEELERLLSRLVTVDGLNIRTGASAQEVRDVRATLDSKRRRPGDPPISARNIARAGQQVFTTLMLRLLSNLHKLCPSDNLVLGGGCALNSLCNGNITELTPFKRVHVFSAPADDGNAVGAALLSYYDDHPDEKPRPTFQSPYLGSTISRETLANVLKFNRNGRVQLSGDAPALAARMLAGGKIIGWIQGRAEFGPRALGNRSILADPRSSAVKERINSSVKFREQFRPLAPAILHEFGAEFFEDYVEAPYMERTLRFKSDVVARVPGVVHVDGTGRLQTVKREWNGRFHDLIRHFHDQTGVPLVLNTSFNVMGKPISHSVEDAMSVFYTTDLDALFIEDVVIEK